jgi:hypothetical protein
VWVVEAPLTVWLTPSPKLHTTLLMDADEGVGIAVNVIGDPAVPTLIDVATETDRAVGLIVTKKVKAPPTIIIKTTMTARIFVRDIATAR